MNCFKTVAALLVFCVPLSATAKVTFTDKKASKIRDKLATLQWICSQEDLPPDIARECDERKAGKWRAKAQDLNKCQILLSREQARKNFQRRSSEKNSLLAGKYKMQRNVSRWLDVALGVLTVAGWTAFGVEKLQ